jgi:hypothetical protein
MKACPRFRLVFNSRSAQSLVSSDLFRRGSRRPLAVVESEQLRAGRANRSGGFNCL